MAGRNAGPTIAFGGGPASRGVPAISLSWRQIGITYKNLRDPIAQIPEVFEPLSARGEELGGLCQNLVMEIDRARVERDILARNLIKN